MLVNFTNHLGIEILDHLSNNIQFLQSGAIDKIITSNLSIQSGGISAITKEFGSNTSCFYQFTISPMVTKEYGSSVLTSFLQQQTGIQTKEIKMNDFGRDPGFVFTNHLGNQITNHLSEPIYFLPENGFRIIFDINAAAQLHRLINSVISNSISITAEVAHHIIMNSEIGYSVLITGTQNRERYITAEILNTNNLNATLEAYRNIDAKINYNADLNSLIMKRIGWWDCIIIKFKE